MFTFGVLNSTMYYIIFNSNGSILFKQQRIKNIHKLQFSVNSLEEGFTISRDVENIHAWT